MIALFSVTWFMSKIVIQMLACWQGRFHRQRSLKIQKDIPYLHIVGNLVREEESLKFAGIECPHHVNKQSLLRSFSDWMNALGSIPSSSFLDIIDPLNFIL